MNVPVVNETVTNLLEDLGIAKDHSSLGLLHLGNVGSRYLKELKLNVSSVLNSSNLSKKEAALLCLAVAINEKHSTLMAAFEGMALRENASHEEIADTYACTSVMNINNVAYRFRHFMHTNEFYEKQPLGLRMGVMLNPVLGKPLFELMSLAVSAINGCERCVTAHEHSVRELGASEARIFDTIRLAAVIKGLCAVL
jgi:lipoyl-dependent peroxiredoxin subunit D